MLKVLFTRYENADALNSELETAINNFFLDTVYKHSDRYGVVNDTMVYCCFNFLGVKVHHSLFDMLPAAGSQEELLLAGMSERERVIACLRRSELYTMVRRL